LLPAVAAALPEAVAAAVCFKGQAWLYQPAISLRLVQAEQEVRGALVLLQRQRMEEILRSALWWQLVAGRVRGAVPELLPAEAQAVEVHSISRVLLMRMGSRDRETVADAVTVGVTAQAAAAAVREALAATHPKCITEEMVVPEWRRQFQALLRFTAVGVAAALTQIATARPIQEGLAAWGVAAMEAVTAVVAALISMARMGRQTLAGVAAARILSLPWLAMEALA